jgi:methylenetetrahydrofolate reductase (NADPH)
MGHILAPQFRNRYEHFETGEHWVSGSGFTSRLTSGKFVLTAEITPPTSLDPAALLAKVEPLRGLADGVNITDGASARAAMDPLAAAALMLQAGVEPIMQLTCRDRNRIALQGSVIGAGALGVRAFLCLTGDDPKIGDQPETKGVFDIGSTDLIQQMTAIGAGTLPGGRVVGGATPLWPGCADMPIDPAKGWEPKGLLAKIAAGARFAQTQFCMDPALLRRYIARLRACGVPKDFPIIVGIAPLASAKSARWIVENLFGSIIPNATIERLEGASDSKAEGEAIALELIRDYATIDGVAGAHIMAPLNEKAMPRLMEAARKAIG